MSDSRSTTGGFLALAAAALFGVSGTVAAGVFSEIDPARVAQTRSVIAAVLLLGFAAWRGVLRPNGGIWKFALLGLNLATVNVTFYWAIDRLGVGPGATIQFLAPVFVLVWIAVIRKVRVGIAAWMAAVAAVLGVSLVTQAWSMDGGDLIGVAAGLASAVLFATYLVYGEWLGNDYAAATLGAWGFTFAALFWAIVLPLWSYPFETATENVLDLVIVGVLGTAVPFILDFVALSMTSSGVVGIIATAEPPIGAVMAALLLDQRLDPVQWVGILIVVGAVAVVQWKGLSETHPATPIP